MAQDNDRSDVDEKLEIGPLVVSPFGMVATIVGQVDGKKDTVFSQFSF